MARKNPDMTTWLLLGGVALGAYLIYKAKKGKPAQAGANATKGCSAADNQFSSELVGGQGPVGTGPSKVIAGGACRILKKDPSGAFMCFDIQGKKRPQGECNHLVASLQLEGTGAFGSLGSGGLGSLGGCGMGSLGAC